MKDPKVLGFKEFLKVNEGNYDDPEFSSEDWPSYDDESIMRKRKKSRMEDEDEDARKERLDNLFSMEDEWNEETGY